MKTRRQFLRNLAITTAATAAARGAEPAAKTQSDANDRAYWLSVLRRVAQPVLTNLAANTLHERMPVEVGAGKSEDRRKFTHLEAFGRTLAGIAPWLQLADKSAQLTLLRHFADASRHSTI